MNQKEKEAYISKSDLSLGEFKAITDCLDKFDNPTYVEVGVYFGGNLFKILNYLRKNRTKYKVLGVDLFEDLGEIAGKEDNTHHITNSWSKLNVADSKTLDKMLRDEGHSSFELIKGYSDKVLRDLPEEFDVIFIDGNHTFDQTLGDALAAFRKAKKDSYFVFHNATNDKQPDKQYVARDGGTWKVCEELKGYESMEFIGLFDRSAVFKYRGEK
jgi:hypothetical protein